MKKRQWEFQAKRGDSEKANLSENSLCKGLVTGRAWGGVLGTGARRRGQVGWILQVGQGNSTVTPIVCQGCIDDR